MKPVGYQFVRARGLSSWLIAEDGGMNLPFSHVDLILPEGLWGARSDRIGGKPPGVQCRPEGYGNKEWIYRYRMTKMVPDEQADKLYSIARSQEKKPYDKLAILSFIIQRNWRDDDSWICSEYGIWVGEQSGIWPPLIATPNKVVPNGLALVCSATGFSGELM
nr:hypothetical protein [uncultured Rhodopila sp.]